MAVSQITKKMFAEELIRMVREKPLEKIRVGELCERCGADRRTFYYHFMDKFDLVSWIFRKDYEDIYHCTEEASLFQHSVTVLEKMNANRAFYKAAFSDTSQNAIRPYLYRYFCEEGTEAMKKHFQTETLSIDKDYAVRAHAHACVELSFEWLKGELEYTPEQFARLQYRFMPSVLKEAYGIEGEY